MKRIVYGTNNKSKIKYMRDMLNGMDLEIVGIGELGIELPHIDECGNNPIDNAVIKAKAYYEAINEPVFSADSGLYFNEVTDDEQPGTTVRRINGKRLTDSENAKVLYEVSH